MPSQPPQLWPHLLVVACMRVVFDQEAVHISHTDSSVQGGFVQQSCALTDALLRVLLVQPAGSRAGQGEGQGRGRGGGRGRGRGVHVGLVCHVHLPSSPPGGCKPVHQLNACLQEAHLVFHILVLCLSLGQALEGLLQGSQGLGVVLVVINLHLAEQARKGLLYWFRLYLSSTAPSALCCYSTPPPSPPPPVRTSHRRLPVTPAPCPWCSRQ